MLNVNGDGFITALDALNVINHLNALDKSVANPEPVPSMISPVVSIAVSTDRDDESARALAVVISEVAEGLVKFSGVAPHSSSQSRVDDVFSNWDRKIDADRSVAGDSDESSDIGLLTLTDV